MNDKTLYPIVITEDLDEGGKGLKGGNQSPFFYNRVTFPFREFGVYDLSDSCEKLNIDVVFVNSRAFITWEPPQNIPDKYLLLIAYKGERFAFLLDGNSFSFQKDLLDDERLDVAVAPVYNLSDEDFVRVGLKLENITRDIQKYFQNVCFSKENTKIAIVKEDSVDSDYTANVTRNLAVRNWEISEIALDYRYDSFLILKSIKAFIYGGNVYLKWDIPVLEKGVSFVSGFKLYINGQGAPDSYKKVIDLGKRNIYKLGEVGDVINLIEVVHIGVVYYDGGFKEVNNIYNSFELRVVDVSKEKSKEYLKYIPEYLRDDDNIVREVAEAIDAIQREIGGKFKIDPHKLFYKDFRDIDNYSLVGNTPLEFKTINNFRGTEADVEYLEKKSFFKIDVHQYDNCKTEFIIKFDLDSDRFSGIFENTDVDELVKYIIEERLHILVQAIYKYLFTLEDKYKFEIDVSNLFTSLEEFLEDKLYYFRWYDKMSPLLGDTLLILGNENLKIDGSWKIGDSSFTYRIGKDPWLIVGKSVLFYDYEDTPKDIIEDWVYPYLNSEWVIDGARLIAGVNDALDILEELKDKFESVVHRAYDDFEQNPKDILEDRFIYRPLQKSFNLDNANRRIDGSFNIDGSWKVGDGVVLIDGSKELSGGYFYYKTEDSVDDSFVDSYRLRLDGEAYVDGSWEIGYTRDIEDEIVISGFEAVNNVDYARELSLGEFGLDGGFKIGALVADVREAFLDGFIIANSIDRGFIVEVTDDLVLYKEL